MITPAHTKAFVLATLHGIEYMHNNFVLHRDLKPNNLLIDLNGVIKIGDFGLAKQFGSPSRELTHQVCKWHLEILCLEINLLGCHKMVSSTRITFWCATLWCRN